MSGLSFAPSVPGTGNFLKFTFSRVRDELPVSLHDDK